MSKIFAVIEVKIKNHDTFKRYVHGHLPSLLEYGGSIVAANPDFVTIEGQREADVLIIHEWPSLQAFHAWHESEEYAPWARLRTEEATLWTRIMLLPEGLPAVA